MDGGGDQVRPWRATLPQPHQGERATMLPARAGEDKAKQGEEHEEGRQVRRAAGEPAVLLAGDG